MKAYGVYLMRKKDEDYEKLIDIVDMPDMDDADDELEITTLSDGQHRFIPGIKGSSTKEFLVNYERESYKKVKDIEGQELELAVWMGFSGEFGNEVPDGSDGKWRFKGYVSIGKNAQNVGDVPQATVRVVPSSVIEYE